MSLDDARRTASGLLGKSPLIGVAVTAILGLSGWTLHTISDHSRQLSGIEQKVDDLTVAVRDHNTSVDTAINKLTTDQQAQGQEIARLEGQEDRQPHFEPRPDPPRAVDPPPPLPQIGAALSHMLGIRGRGTHWRTAPRRGGR
jgi:hypothetical protein